MRSTARLPHAGRVVGLLALAFAGLTCRDGGVTGPGLPRVGRAALAPTLRASRMGPAFRLDAVRAQLVPLPIPPNDGTPALDTVVRFAPGSSQLELELALPITDPQQEFILRIAATELGTSDTLFRAIDTVRLSTGSTPPTPVPVALRYAGADTIVSSVAIGPRDTTFVVGDSVPMRALAFRTGQTAPLAGVRFGWAVSDSAAATISSAGMLKATRAFTGVWVYAGTATDRIDSTLVVAFVPVRRVDLAPPTATLAIGDTLAMTASTFDRNDQPLAGRAVTFLSLDTTASVLPTGRVIGRAVGDARIVAESEGVRDTSVVTVIRQPVATLTLSPDTVRVARRDSFDLVAVARDRFGNVLAGRTVTFTSTVPDLATVSGAGRVHVLRSPGTALIVATAEGRQDTSVVIAQPRAARTVTVSPDSLALIIGQQASLVASALDEQGQPAPDFGIVWSSLDPAVATVVQGAGLVGEVTAVGAGVARIVAAVGAVADTVPVRVRAAVTEVQISPAGDTLEIPALGNDTLQLAAQAFDGGAPVAGARYAWTSRAPAVAIVDTTGLVRSVAPGLATVVVTEQVSGLRDSVVVRVVQRVARIAVSPDTITVAALRQQLRYAAVAYDRNDQAVPVPGFAWDVSGGGVLALDSATGPNAFYSTIGNGTVSVTATVDGVTGSGRATVQQQLFSIVVNPTTVNLSAGGTALLVAQGRDVNNQGIGESLPFAWESDDASVATVDPVTGLVRAVGTGTARITARIAGVVSNQVVVTVSAMAILFEADTIAVGSRTQVQMAVRLSAPAATPIGVGFFFADTGVASIGASYNQVTFPAGTTTQLVPLTGVALGSVRLRAAEVLPGLGCDGACPPRENPTYAPDTTTIVVIAGLMLETRGQLALGDSTEAQLALQSPAPQNGLVVTFDYDVPGIVRVLPDTVIVPGGHLGVAVSVRTLAQGIVRVTPRVVGAADPPGIRSTLQVGPPMMEILNVEAYGTPITIGAGQVDPYAAFALLRLPPSGTLYVSSISRRGLVTVPSSFEVPGGQYGRYLQLAGDRAGIDTVEATAQAPFGTARAEVIVTTPRMALFDEQDADTLPDVLQSFGDDYDYEVNLAVTDSLGRRHPRGSRLTVRLVSSDPSILRPIQEYWVIEPGDDVTSLRVRLMGSGTATLTLSADGHVAATKTVQVQLPKLAIGWASDLAPPAATSLSLAVGRRYPDGVYWWTPTSSYGTFTVDVRHSNPALVGPDTSLTYDYGTGNGEIPLRTLAAGTDTMIVSRAGWEPDTVVLVVRPADHAALEGPPDTVQVGQPIFLQVRLDDRSVTPAARAVRVRSLTPPLLALDTVVTIPAGQRIASYFEARATATGTARIELSTGGVVDTTHDVVVLPGRIEIVTNAFVDTIPVGVGNRAAVQHGDQFVLRVKNATADLAVSVVASPAGIVDVPATIVLNSPQPGGMRVATMPVTGVAQGIATIVVSAPGYAPDTLVMRVVRPAFIEDACEFCIPRSFPRTAKAGESFTWSQAVRFADSVRAELWDARDARAGGFTNLLTGLTTFRITSSDPSVVQVSQPTVGAGITDGSYLPPISFTFVGAGTATITVQELGGQWVPFTRTVTVAPQLLSWQVPVSRSGVTSTPRLTLGTRQAPLAYERPNLCTNGPVAAPFTVAITSTDTVVGRAGAATDTVTFAASPSTFGSCVPIDVEGGRTTGTVGLVARSVAAGPWSSDTLRLIVGRPTFTTPAAWYYESEADTLWLGDTLGHAFEFKVADQAGNPRLTLDTLELMATVTGTGVMAVRAPEGIFMLLPGDDGTGSMIRVAGTAAGRERVVLQDVRSAVSEARRYLVGRTAEVEVLAPYLRLTNADNALAPTARQVNVSYDVSLPEGFGFPEGDTLWVRLEGDPALAVPDSVPYVGGIGVPGLFTINGLGVGATTNLVLRAPGFRPDTASLRFLAGNFALVGSGYFYAGDSALVSLRVENAERFDRQQVTQAQDVTLQLPAGLAASNGTARVTTVRIPAGSDRVDFWLVGVATGSWRVRATHPDFVPLLSDAITVAMPPNFLRAGSVK